MCGRNVIRAYYSLFRASQLVLVQVGLPTRTQLAAQRYATADDMQMFLIGLHDTDLVRAGCHRRSR